MPLNHSNFSLHYLINYVNVIIQELRLKVMDLTEIELRKYKYIYFVQKALKNAKNQQSIAIYRAAMEGFHVRINKHTNICKQLS